MYIRKLLSSLSKPALSLPLSILIGLACGYCNNPNLVTSAEWVSQAFVNLLKLVSMPIIFLSIVSTLSGMTDLKTLKKLSLTVLKYTLFTTFVAALVALGLFVTINPVQSNIAAQASAVVETTTQVKPDYLAHLSEVIPTNIFQPFIEGNVFAVLCLALLVSFAILKLPRSDREALHKGFSRFYGLVVQLIGGVIQLLPIAIWAFVTLFVHELHNGLVFQDIALYLLCVVLANLIQAFVVLPTLLKSKGLSPSKIFKAMAPALQLAFWSKSSAAALPVALECAETRLKVSKPVARFALPMCTTINMNACAAFILITVLFVSMSHGLTFTPLAMLTWCVIATLAAVGNASVPMGCYFLASALLAYLDVPLYLLGVILPFYAMLDMLESAINVWSDCCVTALVDKEPLALDVDAPEFISAQQDS